ncbi:MAG: TonB-dependent receptor [Cyclobacteriaceae bacterium]
MKLRTSFGVSGNDQIGLFRYRGLLNGSATYVFNDLTINGAAIGNTSNPDLKWETTYQTNIGLDFSLFNNLDFTANYFIKNTRDLLFQPDVSALLGAYGPGGAPPVINAGDVLNRGVELELGYATNREAGVNFSADYNVTFLKNEVTAVPQGFEFIPGASFSVGGNVASRFQEGFPIGYFIGYQTEGIFQTQEEIASSSVVQPGAQPGDLRFVDQNGDGMISFGDDADRTQIGSPIPDMVMGFNLTADFKGVDIGANIYAALGQEIIRNYERQQDNIDFDGKALILAEAKFMRAYFYFNLVNYFGDMPLIVDRRISISEITNASRTPRATVYEQIETDLEEAMEVLPWTVNETGRLTRGAAMAMLGKVLLYQNKYAEAATILGELIDDNQGRYALFSDYSTLFYNDNRNVSEDVFTIQFSGLQGRPGEQGHMRLVLQKLPNRKMPVLRSQEQELLLPCQRPLTKVNMRQARQQRTGRFPMR